MERRYIDYGYNLKPVHDMRMTWAQHRGDREAATRQYNLWRRERNDAGADCHACELNTWVLYHVFMEQHEEALTVAKPLLVENSSQETASCAGNPHTPGVRLR